MHVLMVSLSPRRCLKIRTPPASSLVSPSQNCFIRSAHTPCCLLRHRTPRYLAPRALGVKGGTCKREGRSS